MATELTFIKDGSTYVCELNPSTPITVQIQMQDKAGLTVYGFIGDCPPVSLYSTTIYDNIIFQIDVPEGVTVRMVSWSPIINAQMV